MLPLNRSRLFQSSILLAVFVAGLWLRLGIFFGDEASLLTAVPDDAFYYFQLARNVAAGKGVTFDGLHPTNGFHPLWLGLLLPAASVIDEPLLLARTAVGLGIGLNLLATVFLYDWLRRALSPLAALVGVAFVYLNPAAAANSVNGLETALAGLLLVLAVRQTWLGRDPGRLGLLLGGLLLARSDMIFVALPLIIASLVATTTVERWRWLARLGVPLILLVAPWYLWSWVVVGTPWPSSASAVPRITQANFLVNHGVSEWLHFSTILMLRFLRTGLWRTAALPLPFWSLLALSLAWMFFRNGERRPSRWQAPWAALAVGAVALIVIHVSLRWLARAWYFDLVIWLTAVCLAWLVWHGRSLRTRGPSWAFIALLALSLSGWRQYERWLFPYPHQVEFRAAARWLDEALADGEYAGAFNAGIMGYFADGRVVNLDGVINQVAFEAARQRRLLTYMQTVPIRFLVDYAPTIATHRIAFGPDPGVEVIEVFQVDFAAVEWEEAPGEPLRIFELHWSGEQALLGESR